MQMYCLFFSKLKSTFEIGKEIQFFLLVFHFINLSLKQIQNIVRKKEKTTGLLVREKNIFQNSKNLVLNVKSNFERLRNTIYVIKYTEGKIHHDDLPAQKEVRIIQVSGFPIIVPTPATSALPGNLLEIQVIRLHSGPTESETLGVENCNLCVKIPLGDSAAPLRTTLLG